MFGQLFQQADTDNIGVVTGEVAVKFFEKTRLEPRILGEVVTFRALPQSSTSMKFGTPTKIDADFVSF